MLVTWHLETLKKDFTPRLGAPVKHLSMSADDTLISVSLDNNGKAPETLFYCAV